MFQTPQGRDEIESNDIGLAVINRLVTENCGRIWVERVPPVRGTTFVFTWNETAQ
jgi:light-regulated signal transduction histidine kinase (bacteriophytochrome)